MTDRRKALLNSARLQDVPVIAGRLIANPEHYGPMLSVAGALALAMECERLTTIALDALVPARAVLTAADSDGEERRQARIFAAAAAVNAAMEGDGHEH